MKFLENDLIRYILAVVLAVIFIFAGMYIWAPLAIIGFLILFVFAVALIGS